MSAILVYQKTNVIIIVKHCLNLSPESVIKHTRKRNFNSHLYDSTKHPIKVCKFNYILHKLSLQNII